MAGVELSGLVKEYPNGVRGVNGVDLSIADGEFFALLGPSGCGKTTLLRTLAGLESATEGNIGIGGSDVTRMPPGERDIAMVFQDYALFPHMSVTDNIAYPLRIKKTGRAERNARAAETAEHLSLGTLLDRRPSQLSGGQQQRVALARAIASRPQLFLFDEPLSNLDARLRLEARTFLKRLQGELGVTTVFVTHDQAEALAMSDRMAVMDAGRIRQIGTPREVFHRPADTFVANFIGATPMNLLPARVSGGRLDFGGFTLPLPQLAGEPPADGTAVTYGLRPEYLTATTGGGALSKTDPGAAVTGVVTTVENLGVQLLVGLQVGDRLIRATVAEDVEPEPGTELTVAPAPGRALLYAGDDGDQPGRLLSA
ncbi:ABC transporter ATP-binding protein [Nakamurella aerolata]|uniref:ABC transporter ATP-binding protein n=1 Tax=Nakamurella aerolata TaxID=1656892 RepID=A0A849A1I4_9ACTN|nr:ABC transporter ATP-binding protein [Nakamurella aerolata]NNG34489.1 ABC transporter ATP-binding protein [Nakamurella aerolata]